MSKLLPCPICHGGPENPWDDADALDVCCSREGCMLHAYHMPIEVWESLPRPSAAPASVWTTISHAVMASGHLYSTSEALIADQGEDAAQICKCYPVYGERGKS